MKTALQYLNFRGRYLKGEGCVTGASTEIKGQYQVHLPLGPQNEGEGRVKGQTPINHIQLLHGGRVHLKDLGKGVWNFGWK